MKLATLFLSLACLLAASTAVAQSRYSYSGNGAEVTDARTGLVWRRCAEGMSWSGATCAGSASTFTHEAALARAQTQTGWRLPNVKELASIVDRSRAGPSIDTTAFPATPSGFFWSSSPYAGNVGYARGVDFSVGHVGHGGRYGYAVVRLVR